MADRKRLKLVFSIPRRRLRKSFQSIIFRDSIDKLSSCDVLFFLHDANRSSRWCRLPYSPLADSLSVALTNAGVRTKHVSFFGSSQALVFPATPVHLINRSFFRAYLSDVWRALRPGERKAGDDRSVNVEKLFAEIIERSQAKVVVTIGLPKPLALAAHSANVYLVEVLHGFGYAPLPWDYAERTALELPNEFWLGDSLSLETFSQLKRKGVKSTLIQPLHLVHPEDADNLETLDRCDEVLPPSPERSTHQIGTPANVLIVLSRGGYFGAKIDGRVEDWALIKRLVEESGQRVNWSFRLHPLHAAEGARSPAFRKVLRLVKRYQNCSWEWATTSPPGIVYPIQDCVVTWGSEAIFDAYFSGIASGVILPASQPLQEALGKHKAFDHLEERKSLTFLRPNSSEILIWINSQTTIDRAPQVETGARDFASLVESCREQVSRTN